MINGFLQLLIFQAIGELMSKFLIPLIPGPVIGLVLLVAFLKWRGGVPQKIDLVGGAILQHLGLLFIPASVGVVMFLPLLQEHLMAVSMALILSVVATIWVTAIVLKFFDANRQGDEHAS